MPTVQSIVDRALEHLEVKPSGQVTSAEDADLCLRGLVSLLDAWQLDPQTTIGLTEIVYTPAGGTKSFTIGPAGNIVAVQPDRFELSSFYRMGGIDHPLGIANSQDEYNSRPNKDVTGLPQFIYYERGNTGTGTVYLYPASLGGVELHLWTRQDVVNGYGTIALTTNITLPHGYRSALEWNLAAEVAPDFSVLNPLVERKAMLSLRKLKRSNFVSAQIQPRFGLNPIRAASESFAQASDSGSGVFDGGSP